MVERRMLHLYMGEQPCLKRHWFAFAIVFLLGMVVCASVQRSWGEGLGAVMVPAIIGYFIVKGGRSVPSLTLRYLILMAVFVFVISGLVISTIAKAHNSVEISCLTRNSYTAQLNAEKRAKYCRCLSDELGEAIVWIGSTSFVRSKPLSNNVQDVPELHVLAIKRANECAALVAS